MEIESNSTTLWRDIPHILIKEKQNHITYKDYRKGSKQARSGRKSFIITGGDLPSGQFNHQSGQFEEIDNHRGAAYATRRRLKFRKKKEELLYED